MQPTVMTSTLKPEELVETNAKSLKKKTDALLAVFLCLFAGGSCAPLLEHNSKNGSPTKTQPLPLGTWC
jgi:hypothetical protein